MSAKKKLMSQRYRGKKNRREGGKIQNNGEHCCLNKIKKSRHIVSSLCILNKFLIIELKLRLKTILLSPGTTDATLCELWANISGKEHRPLSALVETQLSQTKQNVFFVARYQ